MKNLIPILIVSLAVVSATSVFAAEEYYTWVDENGVTNYAEKNPEGVRATFITSSRAFGRRAPSGRPSGRPDDAGQQSSQQNTPSSNGPDPDALVDEQATQLAAEVAEIKRKNCEIGKEQLAYIKAFSRVRVQDENGQSRILTEDEKTAKAESARQIIRENCTG